MGVAALVTWLVTAAGGATMLGMWLAHGGLRADADQPPALRPPMVFTHVLLAATGLVLWIVYLFTDNRPLAWVAFAVLVVVAVLGDLMFFHWHEAWRRHAEGAARFPRVVVFGHGVFAVATVVLVLLTALGVERN